MKFSLIISEPVHSGPVFVRPAKMQDCSRCDKPTDPALGIAIFFDPPNRQSSPQMSSGA